VGTATLTQSTVIGNTASSSGGGVLNEQGVSGPTTITIKGSTLRDNSMAFSGGGNYNLGSSATIEGSTIWNN
jgi:fibronectin-binding autotransporter adhesin